MCHNATVDAWVECRKYDDLPIPQMEGGFYLVTETIMKEFDSFRDQFRIVAPARQTLLSRNNLLTMWLEKEGVPKKLISFKSMQYVSIDNERIDEFIEWIEETRKTIGGSH